jgi:transposase-like protein
MSGPKRNGLQIKQRRIFSEAFKRQKVQLIVEKKISVKDVSELYGVSMVTVYRWLYRYSPHHNQGTIQVVQMESEEHRTKELLHKLSKLEQVIGQKQLQLDYLERLIAIAGDALQIDIKKNFDTLASNGSEPKAKNKPGP